jgi:hypothetical protein
VPDDSMAFLPLTFDDYVVAMAADRTCVPAPPSSSGGGWWISGIVQQGKDWPVPFVKCDSHGCNHAGQDAHDLCEYGILAVSGKDVRDTGGHVRAQKFCAWLYDRYPTLMSNAMPFSHEFCQLFPSEQSMEDYIHQEDYGSSAKPKIVMGVVFESDDVNVFKYTLRQNSTNYNALEQDVRPASRTTPDTSKVFDSYAKNDADACQPEDGAPELGHLGSSCTGQYIYNGLLPIQRAVNDFIMNVTSAAERGYYVGEAGMSFVPFPSLPYEENGFFADAGSKYAE